MLVILLEHTVDSISTTFPLDIFHYSSDHEVALTVFKIGLALKSAYYGRRKDTWVKGNTFQLTTFHVIPLGSACVFSGKEIF